MSTLNPVHILAWMALAVIALFLLLLLLWGVTMFIKGWKFHNERVRCSKLPLAEGQVWVDENGGEYIVETLQPKGHFTVVHTSRGFKSAIGYTQDEWSNVCQFRVRILKTPAPSK